MFRRRPPPPPSAADDRQDAPKPVASLTKSRSRARLLRRPDASRRHPALAGLLDDAPRAFAKRFADADVWAAASILAGRRVAPAATPPACHCERGDYWKTVIPCSCHSASAAVAASHAPTAPKAYACPYCAQKFTQCGSRNTHIKVVHQKIKEHHCMQPGCGKSYGQRGDLTRHIEAEHHKKSRFVCSKCGRAFPRKYSLTRHVECVHSTR